MRSAEWLTTSKTDGQHRTRPKNRRAVNAYLRSVHADGGGTMSETDIAHRRIATQKITINAIRVLDHEQLDRLQDVLNHIAADREYYMPELRQGIGR